MTTLKEEVAPDESRSTTTHADGSSHVQSNRRRVVTEVHVLGHTFRMVEDKNVHVITRPGAEEAEIVRETVSASLTLGDVVLCTSADAGLIRDAMLRLAVELQLDKVREIVSLKGLRYVEKP